MRRAKVLTAVLVLKLTLTCAQRASADDPPEAPPTVLELSLRASGSIGLSFRTDPLSNDGASLGAAGGLGVLLRTTYFLEPELDVSYAMLFRGHGLAASGRADGAIDALSLSLGPAIDVAPWLRIHAGFALSWIFVRDTVAGARASTSSLQMGYTLGASSLFLSASRLRAGLDLRVLLVTEASMMGITLGVTGSFDAIAAATSAGSRTSERRP